MSIVLALFSCFLLLQTIKAENQTYLKECVQETGIKVTPEMIQKLHKANTAGTFDVNTIPEEMLCLPKCVLEKRHIIDRSGKISTENFKKDMIIEHVPNPETFMKCIKTIDKITTCDDMKKIIQCRIEAQ